MWFADSFPAPRQLKNGGDVRFAVIDEISRQASDAWGMGHAQVAFDFMRVSIPAPVMQVEEAVVAVGEQDNASDVESSGAVGQWGGGDVRQQRARGTRRRGRGRGMRDNYNGVMDMGGMTSQRGTKRPRQ